jgi:CheY-like chemotaxis protein
LRVTSRGLGDVYKRQMQDVAVVVVSTEANRERLERMRTLGVEHTLRKPFEPEALCRLITEVLGVKPG